MNSTDQLELHRLETNVQVLLTESAATKLKSAAKYIVSFLQDRRHVQCLDRSRSSWAKLVDSLVFVIERDLDRHLNHGKKPTSEFCVALYNVVYAAVRCSEGDENKLEPCARKLFKLIYKMLNGITCRETRAQIQNLDETHESKSIGRSLTRTLLELLESQDCYTQCFSSRRCADFIMLYFDLLDNADSNRCADAGKVLCKLIEVSIFGPLGKAKENGKQIPRDLESSNMFEKIAPHNNDLEVILQRIIDWFVSITRKRVAEAHDAQKDNSNSTRDRNAEHMFHCLAILLKRSGPNCIPVLIRRGGFSFKDFSEKGKTISKLDLMDDGIGATVSDDAGGRKIVSYAISLLGSPKPSLRMAAMKYLRLHLQAAQSALPGTGSGNSAGRVFVLGDYAADQVRRIFQNLMSPRSLRKLVAKLRHQNLQVSEEKQAHLLLLADVIFYMEIMDHARVLKLPCNEIQTVIHSENHTHGSKNQRVNGVVTPHFPWETLCHSIQEQCKPKLLSQSTTLTSSMAGKQSPLFSTMQPSSPSRSTFSSAKVQTKKGKLGYTSSQTSYSRKDLFGASGEDILIPLLLLFRTLLREHPNIAQLPNLSLFQNLCHAAYGNKRSDSNFNSSRNGHVLFENTIDCIFQLFNYESRTPIELRVCSLACINQAAFVTSCSLFQADSGRDRHHAELLSSNFRKKCTEQWTSIWLYFLELLSSQSERAWYRRSIINTLTTLLRLPLLVSQDSISLSSSQDMLWSLPCFRGHKLKDLALDESAANLALTYIVRTEVKEGKDSIAHESLSQSDLWKDELQQVLSFLMRTRRGRILVWVLTTPGMILLRDKVAIEAQTGDQKELQHRDSQVRSSAQLLTLSQLFCAASLPGIPLHALCIGIGGHDYTTFRAARGFSTPVGMTAKDPFDSYAFSSSHPVMTRSDFEFAGSSLFSQADIHDRVNRKILDFSCTVLCWWRFTDTLNSHRVLKLRNSIHCDEQYDMNVAVVSFFAMVLKHIDGSHHLDTCFNSLNSMNDRRNHQQQDPDKSFFGIRVPIETSSIAHGYVQTRQLIVPTESSVAFFHTSRITYLLSCWLGGFGSSGTNMPSLDKSTKNLVQKTSILAANCSDLVCSLVYNLHGPMLHATSTDSIDNPDLNVSSDGFGNPILDNEAKDQVNSLKVHLRVLWYLEGATNFLATWRERWRSLSTTEQNDLDGLTIGGAAAPFLVPYLVSAMKKILFMNVDAEQLPKSSSKRIGLTTRSSDHEDRAGKINISKVELALKEGIRHCSQKRRRKGTFYNCGSRSFEDWEEEGRTCPQPKRLSWKFPILPPADMSTEFAMSKLTPLGTLPTCETQLHIGIFLSDRVHGDKEKVDPYENVFTNLHVKGSHRRAHSSISSPHSASDDTMAIKQTNCIGVCVSTAWTTFRTWTEWLTILDDYERAIFLDIKIALNLIPLPIIDSDHPDSSIPINCEHNFSQMLHDISEMIMDVDDTDSVEKDMIDERIDSSNGSSVVAVGSRISCHLSSALASLTCSAEHWWPQHGSNETNDSVRVMREWKEHATIFLSHAQDHCVKSFDAGDCESFFFAITSLVTSANSVIKDFFLPVDCTIELGRFISEDIVESFIRGKDVGNDGDRRVGLFNPMFISIMDARGRVRFLRCMESLLIGSIHAGSAAAILCSDILLLHSYKRTLMDTDTRVRSAASSLFARMFFDMSNCGLDDLISVHFNNAMQKLAQDIVQLKLWDFRCSVISMYLLKDSSSKPQNSAQQKRERKLMSIRPRKGISILLRTHTVLVCIAEVARICPHYTRECLGILTDFAGSRTQSAFLALNDTFKDSTLHETIGELSSNLISSVALSLGYGSSRALVEQNLEFLLWYWLKVTSKSLTSVQTRNLHKHDTFLDGFPFHLLGSLCNDMRDFVESVLKIVVPVVCLIGAVDEIQEAEENLNVEDKHQEYTCIKSRHWLKRITDILRCSESSTHSEIGEVIVGSIPSLVAWSWPLKTCSAQNLVDSDDDVRGSNLPEISIQMKRVENIGWLIEKSAKSFVSTELYQSNIDLNFRHVILALLDIGMVEPFGHFETLVKFIASEKVALREETITDNRCRSDRLKEMESSVHREIVFTSIEELAHSLPSVENLDGLETVISDVEILMHIRGRILECNASAPLSSRSHRVRILGIFRKAISCICKKRLHLLPVSITIVSTLRMVCDEYTECWLQSIQILGESIIDELKGNSHKRSLLGVLLPSVVHILLLPYAWQASCFSLRFEEYAQTSFDMKVIHKAKHRRRDKIPNYIYDCQKKSRKLLERLYKIASHENSGYSATLSAMSGTLHQSRESHKHVKRQETRKGTKKKHNNLNYLNSYFLFLASPFDENTTNRSSEFAAFTQLRTAAAAAQGGVSLKPKDIGGPTLSTNMQTASDVPMSEALSISAMFARLVSTKDYSNVYVGEAYVSSELLLLNMLQNLYNFICHRTTELQAFINAEFTRHGHRMSHQNLMKFSQPSTSSHKKPIECDSIRKKNIHLDIDSRISGLSHLAVSYEGPFSGDRDSYVVQTSTVIASLIVSLAKLAGTNSKHKSCMHIEPVKHMATLCLVEMSRHIQSNLFDQYIVAEIHRSSLDFEMAPIAVAGTYSQRDYNLRISKRNRESGKHTSSMLSLSFATPLELAQSKLLNQLAECMLQSTDKTCIRTATETLKALMCTPDGNRSHRFCRPQAAYEIVSYFSRHRHESSANSEIDNIETAEALTKAEDNLTAAIDKVMQDVLQKKISLLNQKETKRYLHQQHQLREGSDNSELGSTSSWIGLGDFSQLDAIEISLDAAFWTYSDEAIDTRSRFMTSTYACWLSRLCEVMVFSYQRQDLDPVSATSQDFLSYTQHMCVLSLDFVEAIFPVCVLRIASHLIRNVDSVSASHKSQASRRHLLLESLRKHFVSMLDPMQPCVKITALAVQAIDLMRRQGVSLFQRGELLCSENSRSPIHKRNSRRKKNTVTSMCQDNKLEGNIFLGNLGIDYLDVAKAALRCSLPTTALLYAELWQSSNSNKKKKDDQLNSTENISTLFEDSTSEQEDVIFRCHCAMPDPDGIYGVSHRNNISALAQVYAHGGEWNKATAAFDSEINVWTGMGGYKQSENITSSHIRNAMNLDAVYEQLATSIHKQGLHSLLAVFMRGHQDTRPTGGSSWINERTLEALWRTTQWEEPNVVSRLQLPEASTDFKILKSESKSFNSSFCMYLQSLVLDDQSVVEMLSHRLQSCIVNQFLHWTNNSTGSSSELAECLNRLKFGADVHTVTTAAVHIRQQHRGGLLSKLLSTWEIEGGKSLPHGNSSGQNLDTSQFESIEALLALRTSLLRACSCGKVSETFELQLSSNTIQSCLIRHIFQVAVLARHAKKYDIALSALQQLKLVTKTVYDKGFNSLESHEIIQMLKWKLEEANLFWDRGECTAAIRLGKRIAATTANVGKQVSIGTQSQNKAGALTKDLTSIHATILSSVGHWMATTRTESTEKIISKFMKPATEISPPQINDVDSRSLATSNQVHAKTCHTLAQYYDHLYAAVVKRMETVEWMQENRIRMAKQDEFHSLQRELVGAKSGTPKEDNNGAKSKKRKRSEKNDGAQNLNAIRRRLTVLDKELKGMNDSYKSQQVSKNEYLLGAIEHYGRCLIAAPRASFSALAVFRLVSLWFDNGIQTGRPRSNKQLMSQVNRFISHLVEQIDVTVFIPLTPQIVSRLGSHVSPESDSNVVPSSIPDEPTTEDDESVCHFGSVLHQLLIKMVKTQPHILLPHLYALVKSTDASEKTNLKDKGQSKRRKTGSQIGDVEKLTDQRKAQAANLVISEFMAINSSTKSLCDGFSMISEAYITLAVYKHRCKNDEARAPVRIQSVIPNWPSLTREVHRKGVAVLTASRNQRLCTGIYGNDYSVDYETSTGSDKQNSMAKQESDDDAFSFESLNDKTSKEDFRPGKSGTQHETVSFFREFLPDFKVSLSGRSHPKFIGVLDESGNVHRQVLKAGDDLRQDSVMQQFFQVVNSLLVKNVPTRRRGLQVRTYEVVPLTRKVGIMQMVANSEALTGVLKRAHKLWHPNEIDHGKAREIMDSKASEKTRIKNFEKICGIVESSSYKSRHTNKVENICIRPVLGNVLLSRNLDPAAFYRSRLAYTHSVAVNSMTGYIVGIGDRHLGNVLMDLSSSEIIHIDFGVAFEQGRLLNIPERIPFRLTRDLVHGMGFSGTEGVFRRSSESVLSVLRSNSDSLITVLDVLLHDPLYKWKLSPIQRARMQQEEETPFEKQDGSSFDDNIGIDKRNAVPLHSGEKGKEEASKVLLRVKQKLQGLEDPNGEALSTEGQVKVLINSASNPSRLALLYEGWSAWY